MESTTAHRAHDTSYGSIVRDGLLPLVLLRVDADGVVRVEAIADRMSLDLPDGEGEGARLETLLPGPLSRRLIDGVAEVGRTRRIVRLDLTGSHLAIDRAHLMPIGADDEGRVDLVMVLGEAAPGNVRDELTGLPTRELLADRWAQAVARARRGETSVSLLFCDLDGFKAVNDNLGHLAGDEVLQAVAEQLTSIVREHDTVARFGGDEFVVIVQGGRSTAADIGDRIVESLCQPIAVGDGREASIGVSVGVHTVSPAVGGSIALDDALAEADRGMYEAKHGGGGDVRFVETD
ncbi:MAG: GGDEF domain-containing protein [Actinomycetota bacterium]